MRKARPTPVGILREISFTFMAGSEPAGYFAINETNLLHGDFSPAAFLRKNTPIREAVRTGLLREPAQSKRLTGGRYGQCLVRPSPHT
jgi:hypothetical protein